MSAAKRARGGQRPLLLAALVLAAVLAGCTDEPAAAAPDPHDALVFLAEQQLGPGQVIQVLEASVGFVDATVWPQGDPILGRVEVPEGYADLLRLVRGLAGHGLDAHRFGDADLVQRIWDGHDGEQFGSPLLITDDAWAVSALLAAGEDADDPRLQDAVERLVAAQAQDGGWSWDGTGPGNPDETAWVLEALADAGNLSSEAADAATTFLETVAGAHGGYGDVAAGPNCQSTGLALRAYMAMDVPAPVAAWGYLASCQTPDGGFSHKPGGPAQVWVTADVLPALR